MQVIRFLFQEIQERDVDATCFALVWARRESHPLRPEGVGFTDRCVYFSTLGRDITSRIILGWIRTNYLFVLNETLYHMSYSP